MVKSRLPPAGSRKGLWRIGRVLGWILLVVLALGLLLGILVTLILFIAVLVQLPLQHSIIFLSVLLLFVILYFGAIREIEARELATWENVRYPWSKSSEIADDTFIEYEDWEEE